MDLKTNIFNALFEYTPLSFSFQGSNFKIELVFIGLYSIHYDNILWFATNISIVIFNRKTLYVKPIISRQAVDQQSSVAKNKK